MGNLIFFTILLFSSTFFSESFNKSESSVTVNKIQTELPDTIYWRSDIKIHWVDFRGEAEKESSFLAYTSTLISLKYSIQIKGDKVIPEFNVSCAFNCNKSWARKDEPDFLNETLLEHEQLHFDIAELTARKLRKALNNQKFTKENYEYKIEAIRSSILKNGGLMQDHYDNESGHGTQVKEQKMWQKKIEQELKKYAEWK